MNLSFETRIHVWVQTRKWKTRKWEPEFQVYFNRPIASKLIISRGGHLETLRSPLLYWKADHFERWAPSCSACKLIISRSGPLLYCIQADHFQWWAPLLPILGSWSELGPLLYCILADDFQRWALSYIGKLIISGGRPLIYCMQADNFKRWAPYLYSLSWCERLSVSQFAIL